MAHGAALRQNSGDPELASRIMHDYRTADLDPQTRAMLDYAHKLTLDPADAEEEDIEILRRAGLSDEQILSVVLVTCLFAFMTRLADGLGVQLRPGMQKQIETWLTGPAREQGWLMNPKS